jgi:L-threonylcarbamoyladenylate synthase
VFVDPGAPQRDAIEEAAKWILNGGIVALPTDTLYGLAADPFSAPAWRASVRGERARGGAGAAADRRRCAQVGASSGALTPAGAAGGTLLAGTADAAVTAPRALARDVTGGTGKVGVRVPADASRAQSVRGRAADHRDERQRSGEPATADPDVVERTLGDRIDLLIEPGRRAAARPRRSWT